MAFACLVALATFCVCAGFASQKPNIVFILADDYGWNDVGWNQIENVTTNHVIATPNIDALATDGVILDRMYVQPVCSPTRGALLTGRYPMHTGLGPRVILTYRPYGLPANETLVSEILKDNGYYTAVVGKWHLGHCDPRYTPTYRGFDRFLGIYLGGSDYWDTKNEYTYNDTIYRAFSLFNSTAANTPALPVFDRGNTTYATDMYMAEVERILTAHDSTQAPLFLYLPLQSTHGPFQAPQEYMSMYDHIEDEGRRTYAGMVTAMDVFVGDVVNRLQAHGMWNNTLLVFVADNGGAENANGNNYPLRGGKADNWEGGVRVPAFVSGPLLNDSVRGTKYDCMMHITDWLPTMLGFAGIDVPQGLELDGYDHTDVLNGSVSKCPRKKMVISMCNDVYQRTYGAIIRGNWKLVHEGDFPGSLALPASERTPPRGFSVPNETAPLSYDGWWLFNIINDPYEQTNIAERYPYALQTMIDEFNAYRADAVVDLTIVYNQDDPLGNPHYLNNTHDTWSHLDGNICTCIGC